MSKQMSRQQSRQTQRRERKEELHRRELARQAARRRRNLIIGSIVACAVIILGVIITTNLINSNKSSNTSQLTSSNPLYPVVDNISCDSLEHSAFHIHAHLSIYIDGQSVGVPQNVGVASDQSCLYWLHTHDSTGVIHIEAPAANEGYKLGTFFKEWKDVFTSLQYPNQLSATDGWKVYVDGKDYKGDFDDIKLASHQLITLAYNSPNIKPDTTYNWPSDLAQ